MGDNENLSLRADGFWITTRPSICRLGCEAPFHWKQGTHPAVCETETLTHATFIHDYSISSLVLPSIMLYIIFYNFSSAPSAVAGGSQPAVLSCRDGENFTRASEREESGATRKDTKKKKEGSRTLQKIH